MWEMSIKGEVLKEGVFDLIWGYMKVNYHHKIDVRNGVETINPDYVKWLEIMKKGFDETRANAIDLTLAKVRERIEFVDIELLLTDIKDKKGKKAVISDEVLQLIRIWWDMKSRQLLAELGGDG